MKYTNHYAFSYTMLCCACGLVVASLLVYYFGTVYVDTSGVYDVLLDYEREGDEKRQSFIPFDNNNSNANNNNRLSSNDSASKTRGMQTSWETYNSKNSNISHGSNHSSVQGGAYLFNPVRNTANSSVDRHFGGAPAAHPHSVHHSSNNTHHFKVHNDRSMSVATASGGGAAVRNVNR